MRVAALLLCASALLVVGCSANDGQAPSEPVASSSSAITTSDVLSRADEWVTAKLLYCQAPNHAHDDDTSCSATCTREDNPEWDPYRSDCSGFVSWAWGLPSPGRTTDEFAPADTTVSYAIQGTDLQPGDALNVPADHIILFVKWITPNVEAQFYEEPGCSATPNYAHSFTSNVTINGESVYVAYEDNTFTAIRFDSISADPPDASADASSSNDAGQDAATEVDAQVEPKNDAATASNDDGGTTTTNASGCSASGAPSRTAGDSAFALLGLSLVVMRRPKKRQAR